MRRGFALPAKWHATRNFSPSAARSFSISEWIKLCSDFLGLYLFMANGQVHQNTEPAFAGSMKCSPLQPHATPDAHSPMQLKAPFVWIGLNISNLPEMYQLCVHRIEYGKSQSSPLMFATKPQPLRSSHLHPGRASRQICWWAQLRWRLFDI